jgi:hypothetical protein
MLCALCACGGASGCAGREAAAPEPVVIAQRPPEVLTRCPAAPEPPTLPALPAGASVPRTTVMQRDVATGRYLGQVLAAHATCRANSVALRGLLGFDAGAPAAPAPARSR